MPLSTLSALAVITLEFDPVLRFGELGVRLETIGIALAVLVGLLGAASIARRVRDERDGRPVPLVDIILLGVAAVPGAVVGGRLGYGLVNAEYYVSHLGRLFDPSTGGFELTLAVVGGTLTAALFARSLGGRIGIWLHVAALPLLAILGLAKLATALGGTGQGAPFDGPFATAYVGAGPWGSLAPASPAWPSQLLEGLALVVAAALLASLVAPEPGEGSGARGSAAAGAVPGAASAASAASAAGAVPSAAGAAPGGAAGGAASVAGAASAAGAAPGGAAPGGQSVRIAGIELAVPDGRAFFLALWIWGAVRLFVGFTWRDAPVIGPLRAEQLLALLVAGVSSFGFVVRARGVKRAAARGAAARGAAATPAAATPAAAKPRVTAGAKGSVAKASAKPSAKPASTSPRRPARRSPRP